jgi:hypothetical protein
MGEIIREKGYDNIRFNSQRLTLWFPFVDRVLLDIPSTAFFEGMFSGMPVLALYRPAYQLVRQNALGGFGASLRAYNSIDEGLGLVEEFVDGVNGRTILFLFLNPRPLISKF